MDALGKLTGGIAHDYNNMLGVILGYVELLEETLTEQPEAAGYLRQIQKAGQRGAELTAKLLAFSRQKRSRAGCLDLTDLLRGQLQMLEKTLTVRIQLDFDLAEDLWPVWLDAGDTVDAVLNMSINAMHAMEGRGRLTLATSNEALSASDTEALGLTPGDYVLLSITDTGRGMDAETQERIFEPFFSTKGEMGTGLGLSQVYGLVQRSGGVVKVYSEVGHGTRLALYFPRCFNKEERVTQGARPAASVTITGSETLLVVDDEPALRSLSCALLSRHGFKVIPAESAAQALEILERETVHVLISDVVMPGLDGYELANLVQAKLKFHDQQGATIRFCWASLRLNQVRSDYIVFRRLNARV